MIKTNVLWFYIPTPTFRLSKKFMVFWETLWSWAIELFFSSWCWYLLVSMYKCEELIAKSTIRIGEGFDVHRSD